jgi:hypothetical protein
VFPYFSVSYQYDADCSTLLLQTMSFLLRAQQQNPQLAGDPAACPSRDASKDFGGEDEPSGTCGSDEGQSVGAAPLIEVTPDIKPYVEPAGSEESPTGNSSDGERILR